MRVLAIDLRVLRALARGAPALHERIAEAIRATGQDPSLHILRDSTPERARPQWSIGILAGDDYIDEIDLDVRDPQTSQAALALYIAGIIEDLRAEMPALMSSAEVMAGVVRILMASVRIPRTTEKPS